MKLLTSVILFLVALQAQSVKIDCIFSIKTYENIPTYCCIVDEIIITRNDTQTVITGNHLQNKTDLDVQVVEMHSLPSIVTELFTTFSNLRILVVTDLFNIQPGAFKNAQHLTRLIIRNSLLPLLPAYAFDGAPDLSTLNLIQCETTTIDENALFGLTNLADISLFANVEKLPENVFSSLINLKRVFVVENNIETLYSKLFDNNFELFTVYFSGNRINSVSKSFVENLISKKVNQFTFEGNNCGNSTYHISNVDQIHSQLNQCYRNYEEMLES